MNWHKLALEEAGWKLGPKVIIATFMEGDYWGDSWTHPDYPGWELREGYGNNPGTYELHHNGRQVTVGIPGPGYAATPRSAIEYIESHKA